MIAARRSPRLAAAFALPLVALCAPPLAHGCTIDGRPTASANGRQAVLAHLAFTGAVPAT